MEFHRFFDPAVVVVVLGEDLYIIEIFVRCERDPLWKMEDCTLLSWQVLGTNRSLFRSFLIDSARDVAELPVLVPRRSRYFDIVIEDEDNRLARSTVKSYVRGWLSSCSIRDLA